LVVDVRSFSGKFCSYLPRLVHVELASLHLLAWRCMLTTKFLLVRARWCNPKWVLMPSGCSTVC
jgi:hypothetical protein